MARSRTDRPTERKPQESPSPAGADAPSSHPVRRLLRVTRYDRVAALLVALLIILGVMVSMMFVVWASGKVWVKPATIAAQLIEPLRGGGMAQGSARELVEPGEEEVEELLEPQLEETLDAVTDLVSDQRATLDALGGDTAVTSAGGGAGDNRLPGEGGDADVVPRWQRWQIIFAAGNLKTYSQQLDYFGIELGAVGGSDEIDYAFNFRQPTPGHRSGQPKDEGRMYMTWRYGPLRSADLELLRRAGVPTDGRVIMQFVPPKIESSLAAIEQAFMERNQRTTQDVTRTVFEVIGRRGGYEFEVKSQETR
jgi:hypothetical protein